MNYYSLRISVQGNDESNYRDIVLDLVNNIHSVSGLGCFECPNDNPHYHFMIQTTMKLDALRKHVKKLYNDKYEKGEKRYSLQNKKGNENYICKGYKAFRIKKNMPHYDGKSEPIIIWNTDGYTDEDIHAFHDQFWEDQENLYKVDKRKNKKDFIDIVDEWWNDDEVSIHFGLKWQRSTKDKYEANRLAFEIHVALLKKFKSLRRLDIFTPVARKYVGYLLSHIVPDDIMVKLIMRSDEYFG